MSYRCLTPDIFEEGPYKILPIRQQDMSPIKEWRNDQMAILRQNVPLTDEDQNYYWEKVLLQDFNLEHPKQILFSFLKNELLIGYGGLTYIDWSSQRGELSFLLETLRASDSEQYKNDFMAFLRLLKIVVFRVLKLHRIFAETFDRRKTHVLALEEFGFMLEGRLKDHVMIENKYTDSLIHGLLNYESI